MTGGGDDEATPGERTTASPAAAATTAASTALETTSPLPTEAPTTMSTSPAAPQDSLTETCRNGRDGFALSYPTGWHTEADNPNWRCSLFDPNRFVIDPDTELPPPAVLVFVDPHPFGKTYASYTDEKMWRVLSTSGMTVGDRPGSAIEVADTGQLMYEAGTRHYLLLVDEGDRTFVFETIDVVDGYRRNQQVIDAMARTLQISGG